MTSNVVHIGAVVTNLIADMTSNIVHIGADVTNLIADMTSNIVHIGASVTELPLLGVNYDPVEISKNYDSTLKKRPIIFIR